MHDLMRDERGDVTGLRRADGAAIPLDPANADCQAFLAWHGPLPACAPRYWTMVDGRVVAMTPTEQAAADAARAAAELQARWNLVRALRAQRLTVADELFMKLWDARACGRLTDAQHAALLAELAEYRQQLRDLTTAAVIPEAVAWPALPPALLPYASAQGKALVDG